MPPLLQSFAPPLVVAATVAAAVAAAVLDRRRRRAAAPTDAISPRADGLIFTGTGCSSGLPLVQCALEQPARPPHCAACGVALARGRGDDLDSEGGGEPMKIAYERVYCLAERRVRRRTWLQQQPMCERMPRRRRLRGLCRLGEGEGGGGRGPAGDGGSLCCSLRRGCTPCGLCHGPATNLAPALTTE